MKCSWLFASVLAAASTGCLGARSTVRSYYVLHGESDTGPGNEIPVFTQPIFPGTVRVRSLDAEDVYEKFQIVVRRNPYELRYSDLHVWAVKPADMVSDTIGRLFADSGAFGGVTRQLGDTRPAYTLGGELHAIEVLDSDDLWFAHLSMTLTLNRFSTGERLWSFSFDQRKRVEDASYAHAVRALSELLGSAVAESMKQLKELADRPTPSSRRIAADDEPAREEEGEAPVRAPVEPPKKKKAKPAPPGLEESVEPAGEEPIYVPETEHRQVKPKG